MKPYAARMCMCQAGCWTRICCLKLLVYEALSCSYVYVSGGLLDSDMLPTAAALGVPICLMHYRGDPSSMMSLVCRFKASYTSSLRPHNLVA
jgi:hypothetical protein